MGPVALVVRRHLSGAAVFMYALLLAVSSTGAEPYVPDDDAVVLERLPAAGDPRIKEARRLAGELARQPEDLDLALEVASRHIALGTAEGDPRYIGLARGALGPWWQAPEPPPAVRMLRAAILRAQHDFAGSLADLDALVGAYPGHVQAHLDRATVLEATGEFAAAERACFQVARLYPGLVAEACLASAGSLSGSAGPSYATLVRALETAPPEDDGVRLWALTILGEIAARRGDLAAAARHFEDALALDRRDVYLLATYADLLLDQGRYREVSALLAGETRVDTLLLRRAIAARHLGAPDAPALRAALAARFAALRLRDERTHLRDEARFALILADDPARALALARQNFERQRGPLDARILLEAALAAGAPEAAEPVLDWRRASRIEDVTLDRLAARVEGAAS
jgi:tetratricopeptide (TPR) repeat protein